MSPTRGAKAPASGTSPSPAALVLSLAVARHWSL